MANDRRRILQLLQTVSIKDFKELNTSQETQQSTKRYVYGIRGIADLLGCHHC
ncbi:DUF3853 family protein [Myroides odoratimimus]|uniref:DUF3853 family protein n=1 Tax=Myroides odoratimimus TaxID=76832 RepID=UPI002029B65B|nr:DUF3853 family protein [Myroides odoratimimus]